MQSWSTFSLQATSKVASAPGLNDSVLNYCATTQMNVRDMSRQMQEMRSRMEENEQVAVLISGLRGKNIDDSDFADESVVMRLVDVRDDDEDDKLPLAYDPLLIADYWGRRPVAVISRILQLLSALY